MRLTFLLLLCSTGYCYAQQTDTLKLFYASDEYRLSSEDKAGLDAFLKKGWDRLLIRSYTDETDGDDYNLELSKKRAGGVYQFFLDRAFAGGNMAVQTFGESAPVADNGTEEGRALNRQTTVIGYRYPHTKPQPIEDPMKPITTTMNNGFIITYRPGGIPASLLEAFQSGTTPFTLITNTTQMRQTGLYTNTTRGEILSSALVFCGNMNPCKLDSPVLMKIPIPFKTKCPIEKVKFFNAVAEQGKMLWQEQSKELFPEVIDGQQYIRIWMDDFCQCINFDFKIDPDCFDVDSTQFLVNAKIKGLTTELVGLNSVYVPRQISASTHRIVFLKDKPAEALVSFSAYYGKRWIKRYSNKPLTAFPYDSTAKSYVLSVDSVNFYLPGFKDYFITLRVNGDRYNTFYEKDHCQIVYLKRKDEAITIDLWVPGKKGKIMEYKAQPLASIPFDKATGRYVIDKAYLKELELKKALTKR